MLVVLGDAYLTDESLIIGCVFLRPYNDGSVGLILRNSREE
ncbi:MAG: hypothetical protein V7L31_27810 [Nostoc sp.]